MAKGSIFKDSLMLTVGKSSRTFLMMIFAMFATRFLTEGDYGTYKQMVLINTMLVAIIPLGIPISVSYYYQNLQRLGQSKLVSNTIVTSFGLSAVCFIGMLVLKPFVIQLFNNNMELSKHYFILAMYVFVTVMFSFLENLFVSTGDSMLLGIINIVFSIAFFSGILAATYFTKNLSYVFFWMFLSELVKSLIMCAIIQKKYKYSFGIDISFLKEQFIYCLPLGLVAIAQFLNNYLDKLSISNQYTPEEFAVYVNGASEVPFIGLITVSVATVILPQLSRIYNTEKDVDKMVSVWKDTQKNTAIILYPLFWAMLLCCHGFIVFLYSETYIASVPYFVVFLMKQPMAVTVYGNILIILKKQKYTFYNFCITIVLNLTLNIVLIRLIGMIGAAISTIFCQLIITFLQLYQIGRFTGYKKRDLMPFKDLFKLLFSGGAVTLVLFIIMQIFDFGHVLNMFIYGPISVFACFGAYILLGYIKLEDIISMVKKLLADIMSFIKKLLANIMSFIKKIVSKVTKEKN